MTAAEEAITCLRDRLTSPSPYRDALHVLVSERERLLAAVKLAEGKQREALAICRRHGFVFKDIGNEPGNWQHLAFTFYTLLCEIQAHTSTALDAP